MTPISLYIHIPFCKSKCNYCSFISSFKNEEIINKYIDCLIEEIKINRTKTKVGVDTIFIGGGTPSILNIIQLEKLLSAIRKYIIIVEPLEYTFECNPESLNYEKLILLQKYGVNRLSIGLQTANDSELKLLGRSHDYKQFLQAYRLANEAGFNNISIDLMFAFPKQTMQSFENTLRLVTKLKPTHISCYSLIIEEDTKIALSINQNKLQEIEEDVYINMYRFSIDFFEKEGYHQYEISNFAKNGYESKHNIGYWTHKNYLGLGVAAHSYIDRIRFSNTENINTYITRLQERKSPIEHSESISDLEIFEEIIMLEIRMNTGINLDKLKAEFDVNDEFTSRVNKLISRGLLEESSSHIKLTQEGRELCNTVILELVK